MKSDPGMKKFMKQVNMYIQDQYEIPEIRVIRPTHLVRCGDSSGYDVNFGKEAGAGAVILLMQGQIILPYIRRLQFILIELFSR